MEDVAYITVYFDNNVIAHFNVNWLFAGEGKDNIDRRREEDAGLERPGAGREDPGITTKASRPTAMEMAMAMGMGMGPTKCTRCW